MNGGGNAYGNRLDNRQRGNASQLLEKYKAMARDAQQAGDRVAAEYYLQYADHYYRVLGDYRERQPEPNRQRGQSPYEDVDGNQYAQGNDADNDDGDEIDTMEQGDSYRQGGRDDYRSARGQGEDQGDNRRERPNDDRRPQRDGQREQGQRDQGQREQGQRDQGQRDQGQREQGQREQGQREQAPREQGQRPPRREYQGDRQSDRPRGDWQPERAPARDSDRREYQGRNDGERNEPAFIDAMRDPVGSGIIPGLPGPATLNLSSSEPVIGGADGADVPAPRRRGRPRKVVAEAPVEG